MWGKAYDAHRMTGRMTQDSSMRMSNKAETGFGLVGTLSMIILFLMVIGVFL